MNEGFRAGAASVPLSPPLGLPMVGFVRQPWNARGYGLPLEAGAIVLERASTRIVLCGVDIVGIVPPTIDHLIARVSEATGAEPAGVLINWSHTHLAPPGGPLRGAVFGDITDDEHASVESFSRVVQDKIVSACALAAARLEPAGIVWGQADADLAVNRRERTADGFNGGSILGWNPDELIDNQVSVLQARRADESVIGTLFGYGCHPVTTGYDMDVYSADFPGPARDVIRSVTGGEAVFFQGSGGNVLPRFAFTDTEDEAQRMGRRLGLAALEAVADRFAAPQEVYAEAEGSVTPISRYRRRSVPTEAPELAAISQDIELALQPHPPVEQITALREEFEAELEAARASGDRGRVKVSWYHVAWARKVEAGLRDGTAPTAVPARIHAVRIGDGLIITGPGETFTEIGMAVKERAPGAPTFYCGYTNDIVGYLPTAAEYAFGGYEAGYGNRSVGLPSLFERDTERVLVEGGVRLGERLFPDCSPWDESRGWTATGEIPRLDPAPRFKHPGAGAAGAGSVIPVR